MLLALLAFLLLGVASGTITGLIPGIHINLVAVFLLSMSADFLTAENPIYLVAFITAMAITHTFVDFIPSVFLGCPDTDTELSVLPGHELLKKGHGYQAVLLTTYGGLAAIPILMLIAFPSILLISKTYEFIKQILPYLLIVISIFLISLERKKLRALFVFLLTGALGYFVLNMNINQPLLPLLTGLFGSSMLILSIKNKIEIPKQEISKPKTNLAKPLLGSLVAAPVCSFLPCMGSGQAAIIANTISRTGKKGFLVLLGATNTLVMAFSFISLHTISRTRTGAAVAIQQLINQPTTSVLILILAVVIIAGITSFFLTLQLAKIFSQKITKFNYAKISIIILVVLGIINFLISGFFGLLVLGAATATGIYCISLRVRRTQMMGVLLVPTIIYYLF